jgi:hypothetical protein
MTKAKIATMVIRAFHGAYGLERAQGHAWLHVTLDDGTRATHRLGTSPEMLKIERAFLDLDVKYMEIASHVDFSEMFGA